MCVSWCCFAFIFWTVVIFVWLETSFDSRCLSLGRFGTCQVFLFVPCVLVQTWRWIFDSFFSRGEEKEPVVKVVTGRFGLPKWINDNSYTATLLSLPLLAPAAVDSRGTSRSTSSLTMNPPRRCCFGGLSARKPDQHWTWWHKSKNHANCHWPQERTPAPGGRSGVTNV